MPELRIKRNNEEPELVIPTREELIRLRTIRARQLREQIARRRANLQTLRVWLDDLTHQNSHTFLNHILEYNESFIVRENMEIQDLERELSLIEHVLNNP